MDVRAPQAAPSPAFSRGVRWSGIALGVSMGGFLDGILLHQVLQWHHLLSALDGEPFRDIRLQVMADGYFHVLHYLIALAGLALLWRARMQLAQPGADRLLLAWFIIGFGGWHVFDGIVSHWVLGIHHVRMAAANRFVWDLLFFLFGVAVTALGWMLLRHARGAGRGGGAARAPVLIAGLVLGAAPAAALPSPGAAGATVLFAESAGPAEVLAAVAAVDGRLVAGNASGQVWTVDLPSPLAALRLYRHGAVFVGAGPAANGCFAARAG